MEECGSDLEMLRARLSGLSAHLEGPWAKALEPQRHLDQETAESAYWHSGYHQALNDILQMMARREASAGSAGNSSLFLQAC